MKGRVSAPRLDVSRRTLKTLANEVAAEILRRRQEKGMLPLKILHTDDMNKYCDRWQIYPAGEVLHLGSNPIPGTTQVLLFDANSPLLATVQLEEVAAAEESHGKNGKLALDDAHRIAVQVCPSANPDLYRVVVGYWYSRFGVFWTTYPAAASEVPPLRGYRNKRPMHNYFA